VRGLAAGGYFEYHGTTYDLPPVKIAPVPAEPVPVLIGGHSEPALRRAARLGTAGCTAGRPRRPAPAAGPPGRAAARRRTRPEGEGRSARPFEVHVISMDAYTADGVRRLEDQGVTDVIIGFRWPYVTGPDTEPLARKIDNLRRFADDVIAKT